MRLALYITSGVLAVLGLGWIVFAQNGISLTPSANPTGTETHQIRTITVVDVEVRSGPSDTFYPTSKLRKGDKVAVVGKAEQPGWLKIRPPVGSVSWINARHIKRTGQYLGVVDPANEVPVPIKIGSAIYDKAPNKESLQLQRGAMVIINGPPKKENEEEWLPIYPMPGEVRYLPEQAVAGSIEEADTPPAAGTSACELIAQAEKAMQQGNTYQAENLLLVATQRAGNHAENIKCWQHLETLKMINSKNSGTPPGVAATFATQKVAKYPASSTNPARSVSIPSASPRWTEWGYLRKSSTTHQGQPMYILEDRNGSQVTYATTTSNLTLEPYVGRLICMYGTPSYRSDDTMRNHYMMVSHVSLP